MEDGGGIELSILTERLFGYDADYKTGKFAGIAYTALGISISLGLFLIAKQWFGFTISF